MVHQAARSYPTSKKKPLPRGAVRGTRSRNPARTTLFFSPLEISLNEKDEYDLEINRVQDKSSSAVFCFYDARTDVYSSSADFCFIHSVINRWAKEFPHVALYEIIIDHLKEEDRNNKDKYKSILENLNITLTPTFHFYQNGKKVAEITCKSWESDAYEICLL
ncbi:hypothetical protein DVH24_027235 [Malus domestica]|uniref:Thioredoxin domain-containing protein n=1 Tax=Malus domestica TaxID=3750 RepID=A0A498ILW7_MALDO|nr:hypothetical protein DVH24_027235 [Malus domestica]